MRGALAAALLLCGCPPPPERRPDAPVTPPVSQPAAPKPDAEPRAVAERFLAAAEKGEWAAVLPLLARPLRERYSADRLGEDFKREPLAKDRLAKLRAALPSAFAVEGDQARLPLEGAKAFRLVRERGAWFVAALE